MNNMSDDFAEFVRISPTMLRQVCNMLMPLLEDTAVHISAHPMPGCACQGSSVAAKVLADSGVTLDRAELALNLTPHDTLVVSTGAKGLSETAKLTLKMSWDVAQEFHQGLFGYRTHSL